MFLSVLHMLQTNNSYTINYNKQNNMMSIKLTLKFLNFNKNIHHK